MRKAFHQYFRPSKEKLNDLWQQGLLSFDASVLLNVYGYSKKTRDDLVELIEQHAERVRLPHQFGLEFARNRTSVIVKQVANCQKVEDALRKIRDTDIAPKRDHPYLSKKSTRAFQSILHELEESRKTIEKLIGDDPYVDRMFQIFDGRIGDCPTPEQRSQLEADARQRYEKSIPPGFADLKDKGFPNACADYVAWHQLMEIAKKEKKGIILVIDDVKEDWWLLERGRTLGPRPELLEEFTRLTERQFYMYNSENFLRAAKEFAFAEIRDDVLEEVSQKVANEVEAALRKFVFSDSEPAAAQKGVGVPPDKGVPGDNRSSLKQPGPVADSIPSGDKSGSPVD